ncbi:hypothetical protein Leryth_018561 [Lithospermum erythrorhizon]|nr:hypothetical protein Leryth_018561 [Lithospermum erythrorhizon]
MVPQDTINSYSTSPSQFTFFYLSLINSNIKASSQIRFIFFAFLFLQFFSYHQVFSYEGSGLNFDKFS